MSLAEFDEIDFTHSAPRLDRPSAYLMKKARRRHNGLQDIRDSYKSATIYVGNLSFYTTEEQIYELFSKVGQIKQIIMGLDRFHYTPCGFCFVVYKNPQDAINAVKYLSDTKLEDKMVQIDLDPGFQDGRQFGRGASGGQVKDEYKFEYGMSGAMVGPGGVQVLPPGVGVGVDVGQLDPSQEQGQFMNDGLQPIQGFQDQMNLPNVRFGARRANDQYNKSDYEQPQGDSYIPGEENQQ